MAHQTLHLIGHILKDAYKISFFFFIKFQNLSFYLLSTVFFSLDY